MGASAGEDGCFEAVLSTCLLSDRLGSIVLIGGQQIDAQWLDAEQTPPLLQFATLADCSDIDIAGPVVAILQLADQTQNLDEALGRAVRLFPEQLLVCLEDATPSDQTFFAFGFRRLNAVNSVAMSASARWFEYRLSAYKSSPDWLNARFWANPERYDVELELYSDDDDDDDDDDEED